MSVCICLLFSISTLPFVSMHMVLHVHNYIVDPFSFGTQFVFMCALQSMSECTWTFFSFAVGFLSGLQLLKSMRFNTSSNLTLWHRFEAMKVRLERHRSSFLSTESWSYVIALRPVKFPLKRHAPEGEDKAATWSVSLISLFYKSERTLLMASILLSHLIVVNALFVFGPFHLVLQDEPVAGC